MVKKSIIGAVSARVLLFGTAGVMGLVVIWVLLAVAVWNDFHSQRHLLLFEQPFVIEPDRKSAHALSRVLVPEKRRYECEIVLEMDTSQTNYPDEMVQAVISSTIDAEGLRRDRDSERVDRLAYEEKIQFNPARLAEDIEGYARELGWIAEDMPAADPNTVVPGPFSYLPFDGEGRALLSSGFVWWWYQDVHPAPVTIRARVEAVTGEIPEGITFHIRTVRCRRP